jgi:hypothetical protein
MGFYDNVYFQGICFKVLEDFHEGSADGHFGMNTTILKILSLGY